MNNIIPSFWETERLTITDIVESDLEKITEIYEEPRDWSNKPTEDGWAQKEFQSPELPPNGIRENHKFQAIRYKESSEIIGYLGSYYGFKTEDSAWIADLFFLKKYTHQGFGRELVTQFVEEVKKLNGYSYIGCTVNLMNWPGIRFWTKIGFSKVAEFFGDMDYAVDKTANLALEYTIASEIQSE